jgi:photosynthetic reaction center H subunit
MYNTEFFGTFDVPALILTLFTGFFIGLIIYLRREDRREGYPLEDDVTGRAEPASGFFFTPKPKTFDLGPGRDRVHKPNSQPEGIDIPGVRRSRVPGTPLQPEGDPMTLGVGPGAFAQRSTLPDAMVHGGPKIAPLRRAGDFLLDRRDPDPRGMPVLGVDGVAAGVVSDLWVDRGEILLRYLEVELAAAPAAGPTLVGREAAGRRVLLPLTMAKVSGRRAQVQTDAITAAQFAGVPALADPDVVTRDEEERIAAYYGAGYLYATPARAEPLL